MPRTLKKAETIRMRMAVVLNPCNGTLLQNTRDTPAEGSAPFERRSRPSDRELGVTRFCHVRQKSGQTASPRFAKSEAQVRLHGGPNFRDIISPHNALGFHSVDLDLEQVMSQSLMKAWRLERFGGALTLEDVPVPKVRAGAVLIRIEASPLLSYLKAYVDGKLTFYNPPPGKFTPGTNGVGIIDAVGQGTSSRASVWCSRHISSPARMSRIRRRS